MTQWFVIYNTASYDSSFQQYRWHNKQSSYQWRSRDNVVLQYSRYERVASNAMNTSLLLFFFFFLSNKREERSIKTKPFIYILHEFYMSRNKFSGIRSIYRRGSLGNFFIRIHAYILDTHARTHARNDVLVINLYREMIYVNCTCVVIF